ncbi:MAG TPA: sugar ABC transporter permease [Reyranella sp.]|nr:sugar ABC transporter permease [Reyranella sp.]
MTATPPPCRASEGALTGEESHEVPRRAFGQAIRLRDEPADARLPGRGAGLSRDLCRLPLGAQGRARPAAAWRVPVQRLGELRPRARGSAVLGGDQEHAGVHRHHRHQRDRAGDRDRAPDQPDQRLDLAVHAFPHPAALRHPADLQRPDLVVPLQLPVRLPQSPAVQRRADRRSGQLGRQSDTALYAVSVPYIWRTLPFAIILVHATLQGIPRELYEQASIDGANAWHRFRQITLPMLQQIIAIILILRTAFAFAVFEEILAITQGGPGDATWVAAWYSYKITFSPPNNFGMGAASAFILALMVAAIALIYLRAVYRRVQL